MVTVQDHDVIFSSGLGAHNTAALGQLPLFLALSERDFISLSFTVMTVPVNVIFMSTSFSANAALV